MQTNVLTHPVLPSKEFPKTIIPVDTTIKVNTEIRLIEIAETVNPFQRKLPLT